MDNPVVSLNNDYNENQSLVLPNDKEIKLGFALNNDYSSEQTLGNIVKSIKLKQQIKQIKGKLEKAELNSIVLKDEVQNLRNELLTWIKRWHNLKEKKDRLKTLKKSWITANRKLLKQEEQQKMESIKLRAKLSEARRVIRLRSAP